MATILTKISLEGNWLITIFITVCAFFLARFWFKIKRYPPGPIPLPIIGNLLSFRSKDHPFSVLDSFRQTYGDIFTLWMGSEPMVIISNWNLMKEALINKSKDFAGRQKRIFGEIMSGGHTSVVFGDYSSTWEVLKKIAVLAVRKYVMTEKLRDLVCTTVDEMIQKMLNEKRSFNPKELLSLAMQNIVAESAYGQRYQGNEREYEQMKSSNELLLQEFANGLPSEVIPLLRPVYWPREQRFRTAFGSLRRIIFEKYNEHTQSYQPGIIRDFTDAVIAARRDAEMEENPISAQLSDDNLVNIVVDLFSAGTLTVIASLTWLFLLIANNEDVQKKMVAEIDEVIGSRLPTQEDKAKCQYISAVLMEAQRFKAVVPLGVDHKTTCDTELDGHPIKEGTTILLNLHAHHMDPKNWPEPTEFKPERFLVDDDLTKVRKDGYVSFSAGRRKCLGEKLALMEMFLIVVRVLQQCTIALPNGPGTADLGLTDMVLFLVPKHFEIIMKQRKDLVN